MQIVHHAHLNAQQHDGEQIVTAADATLGVHGFEVRVHRLAPGAHGAELRHAGEQVVVVLAGCGKLLLDGAPQRFAAPCTVRLPPRRCAQFVNHGSEPLLLVAVRAGHGQS